MQRHNLRHISLFLTVLCSITLLFGLVSMPAYAGRFQKMSVIAYGTEKQCRIVTEIVIGATGVLYGYLAAKAYDCNCRPDNQDKNQKYRVYCKQDPGIFIPVGLTQSNQ